MPVRPQVQTVVVQTGVNQVRVTPGTSTVVVKPNTPGPAGPPGADGESAVWDGENLQGSTIYAGQPVSVRSTGGGAVLASASDNSKPVAGLASANVASTVSGEYQAAGVLEMADWTNVIGTTNLSPGSTYYLSTTAGRMTTSVPSGSGQSIQVVGRALSSSKFLIQIENYGRR